MDVEKLLARLSGGLERCSRCNRDCCRQAPVTLADIKRIMPRAEKLWREKRLKVKGARGELKVSDLFMLYKRDKERKLLGLHRTRGKIGLSIKYRDIPWRECRFKECFDRQIEMLRCAFLDNKGYCLLYPKTPLFCRLYGFRKWPWGMVVGGCMELSQSPETREYLKKNKDVLAQIFAMHDKASEESDRFVSDCLKDEKFLMETIGKKKLEVQDLYEGKLIDAIFKRYLAASS